MTRLAGVAGSAALLLALTLLSPPATAEERAPAAQVDAPVPVLTWGPCPDVSEPEERAECATAAVPLDYDDPTGETVDLDLLRMAATDPAARIGTLFVNPGGPGGSSRFFASYVHFYLPDEVVQRFDIVGIDPRGVGPSAPMFCRTYERQPGFPRVAFPMTGRQVDRQIAYDEWVRAACRTERSPIVAHMSTADTARDMDLVRQAVGDERLTYVGVSYGTQLAATYVAMFPDRVRAVIADGVLDPVAWSTGDGDGTTRPFSERLGSGYGAWEALTSAFAECDRVGPRRCQLAGRASEVWLDIVSRLRKRPFHYPGGGRLRYQDVVAGALGSLYDHTGIRYLMGNLADLHRAMFGRGDRTFVHPRAWVRDERALPGPYAPAWARGARTRVGNTFAGVACADSTNPDRPRAWVRAGKRADHASPWFGRLWTWASSPCAGWAVDTQEDRFTGPWAVTTAAPVLVVGNSHDPATPIHGARALHRLLDGSRLLILDSWGHGALGSGPCITQAYGAYLLDGTLPPAGTVCRPRKQLFP